MSAAQPSLLNTIRRRIAGMNRWVRFLLFLVLTVLSTKAYEIASDRATLDAAVAYQESAVASLGKATPQSTYLLFKESLGYDVSESRNASRAYRDAAARCHPAGEAALSAYLSLHPGIGRVFVANDGTAACIPGTTLNLLLGGPESSVAEQAFGTRIGLSLMVPSQCKAADDYAAAAEAHCIGAYTGVVEGWGQQLSENARKTDFFYWSLALRSLAPGAALADIVVHNFVEWSPGVVFRWLLLAAGIAASISIVMKCASIFGLDSLAGVFLFILFSAAAIPAGSVIIFTVGALAAYYAAGASLWLSGDFLKLFVVPLVLNAGFLVQTAYATMLEAAKHKVDTTITKTLDL
jgi:hypothetical protein